LDNPTIPGNPGTTKFERIVTMEDGAIYNTSYISICTHNDSHVDSPGHFSKDVITVDTIPSEGFFFSNVVVIDATSRAGLEITVNDLANLKDDAELLLIHSTTHDTGKHPVIRKNHYNLGCPKK